MIINVTQEHINKARPFGANCDPVGLAIEGAIEGATAVIGWELFSVTTTTKKYYGQLAPNIKQLLLLFDYNCSISPFAIKLHLLPDATAYMELL